MSLKGSVEVICTPPPPLPAWINEEAAHHRAPLSHSAFSLLPPPPPPVPPYAYAKFISDTHSRIQKRARLSWSDSRPVTPVWAGGRPSTNPVTLRRWPVCQSNGIESPNLIMWLGVSHPICNSQGHAHVALAWIWCFCRVICLFPQALAKQKCLYALHLAWANNRRDSWIEEPPLLCPLMDFPSLCTQRGLFCGLWNVKVACWRNCSWRQETGKWFPWGRISCGSC